jgi:hypothetical protein
LGGSGPIGGADYTRRPPGGLPGAGRGAPLSDRGILCPMLEDVRKYVRAGIEAVAAGRSEEIAPTVVPRAQTLAEQMSSLADGFLEWSAEAAKGTTRSAGSGRR